MTIFFESWNSIIHVAIIALVMYPILIFLLRVIGKRSLAKLNMFDFVITVALGSIFGSAIISESIVLLDAIIAILALLLAQALISYLSVPYAWVEELIKSEPTMVFFEGEFLEEKMKSVRVTKAEIYSQARQSGISCMTSVYAVILETNGTISVLPLNDNIKHSTLKDVPNRENS